MQGKRECVCVRQQGKGDREMKTKARKGEKRDRDTRDIREK
jgi:hypothetical protein